MASLRVSYHDHGITKSNKLNLAFYKVSTWYHCVLATMTIELVKGIKRNLS